MMKSAEKLRLNLNNSEEILALDNLFSKHGISYNTAILLLGAEFFALLDKTISLVMKSLGFFIIQMSAFYLVISLLLITFSSLNYYNAKIFVFTEKDGLDSEKAQKRLEKFIKYGRLGQMVWLFGISTALIAALIFIVRVGQNVTN